MDVFVRRQEINHRMKLARQVEVIVLREIDDFCVPLFQKDLNLLDKSRPITEATQMLEPEIIGMEVFRKELGIFWRTTI
jgi:hypothetical protein